MSSDEIPDDRASDEVTADAVDRRARQARAELADRLDPEAPPLEPLRARARRRTVVGSAAAVLVVLAVVAAVVALGSNDGGDRRDVAATTLTNTPGKVRSLRSAEARTAGDPRGVAAAVTAENAFAADLYGQLAATQDGNFFFSPHSASVALSMTLAGAAGNTEAELARALHLEVPEAAFHDAVNALDQQLTAPRTAEQADAAGGAPLELRTTNALWGQEGFPFVEAFLDQLARSYDAGMEVVDFVANAEAARLAINTRVAEETEGKIPELIPPGIIDGWTRLVLVNTIFFRAGWAEAFQQTRPAPFTRNDGTEVTVPMMSDGGGRVTDGDGWRAGVLPYLGGAELVVVVPDDLTSFELTPEIVEEASQGSRQADLSLPEFSVTSDLDLVPSLEALGVADLFDDQEADLSGMGPAAADLYVKAVLQSATITVDPQGTEAAAATAVIVAVPVSAEVEGEPLVVDRPFAFAIRDTTTGAILFAGRVLDPTV